MFPATYCRCTVRTILLARARNITHGIPATDQFQQFLACYITSKHIRRCTFMLFYHVWSSLYIPIQPRDRRQTTSTNRHASEAPARCPRFQPRSVRIKAFVKPCILCPVPVHIHCQPCSLAACHQNVPKNDRHRVNISAFDPTLLIITAKELSADGTEEQANHPPS